jgi:hypothetical protein
LNFAILFSATSVIAQVLCDMTFRPEYLAPLRQEAEEIQSKSQGKWTKSALGDLDKLDSFIRESHRLNPTGASTYRSGSNCDGTDQLLANISRRVVKAFTLPDGTYLPVDTHVQTSILLHNLNDGTIEKPANFDGFRWSRLRELTKANEHKWIQITTKNLAFGYRLHACPGRSVADLVFKLFFAEFLLKFDMIPATAGNTRPKSEMMGERVCFHCNLVLVEALVLTTLSQIFYNAAYPLSFRARGV